MKRPASCLRPLARAAWVLPLSLVPATAQPSFSRIQEAPRAEQSPEAFRRSLAREARQTLLLLPDAQAEGLSRLETLLAHPALRALDLKVERLDAQAPLSRALKAESGLAGTVWMLWDPSGRLLAKGAAPQTDAATWAQALVAAGAHSPVAALEAFLERHPDHLDARVALIQVRLRLAQAGLPKGPLTPEEDARRFGPLARDLAQLLTQPGGPGALPVLDWLPGLPEGRSPSLQALARRTRGLVEDHVRRTHDSKALDLLACFGLWTGEGHLAGFLASLEPVPASLGGAHRPDLQARTLERLALEARTRQDWEPLRQLLTPVVDNLLSLSFGIAAPPTPDEAWDAKGLGLLVEALLRLGREGEAEALVQAFLDWQDASPLKASRLALGCGKADLARKWASLASAGGARPKVLDPEQTRPVRPQVDLSRFLRSLQDTPATLLLLQDQDLSLYRALVGQRNRTPLRAWEVGLETKPLDSPVARGLQAREGWEGGPRWALLTHQGKVLATGTTVPAEDLLPKALEAAGIPTHPQRLEAFLRRHPNHAVALTERLTNERMGVFRDLMLASPSPADEARIWGPMVELLTRITAQPDTWVPRMFMPLPSRQIAQSTLLREAAPRLVAALEAQLRQRPAHADLWDLWGELVAASGQDPTPFLNGLEPWPGHPDLPPPKAARQLVQHLKGAERWPLLVRVLTPVWDRMRDARVIAKGRPTSADLLWDYPVAPLLEANLRLGHLPEAEQLIEALGTAVQGPLPWNQAAALARTCGVESLASRWGARAKS